MFKPVLIASQSDKFVIRTREEVHTYRINNGVEHLSQRALANKTSQVYISKYSKPIHLMLCGGIRVL